MPQPAIAQQLDQGLALYKLKKYGAALACFKEVVKNLREFDTSKQQVLARALQSIAVLFLKKGKYKKSIKSSKWALRVLHCLARTAPESKAAEQLAPTQHNLLLALQAFLQFTLEQHQRLLNQELRRGQPPRANLIQLAGDGLRLLTKPLIRFDGETKTKLTRLDQSLRETLILLLSWLQEQTQISIEKSRDLAALSYCKIAAGPLREALKTSAAESAPEHDILARLQQTQTSLEASLLAAADQHLEQGQAAALKSPPELETARQKLLSAAQNYDYLENPEKALRAQQQLKAVLSLQRKDDLPSLNFTGGKKRPSHPAAEQEPAPAAKPEEPGLK